MNWLDRLPSELVAEIYEIVKAQAHAEVLGELHRVKHTFVDNCHTIDFSGIDNGTRYLNLLSDPKSDTCEDPPCLRQEVETTVTHYFENEPGHHDTNPLGAVVMITSKDGEDFRIV